MTHPAPLRLDLPSMPQLLPIVRCALRSLVDALPHVRLDDEDGYVVEHVVEGDSVDDVLRYVQYDRRQLVEKVRRTIEAALRRGEISLEESARLRKRYEQGLREYTYLSRE